MNKRQSGSTAIVRMACAIVFISFTFLFLYVHQAPTLTYLQHALSEGQTSYSPFAGALIITVILMVVQVFTSRILRLSNASHSLTYAPSLTLMVLLTNVDVGSDGPEMGLFPYFLPIVVLLMLFFFRLAKEWIRIPQKGGGMISSEPLLLNLFSMLILMASVILFSNGDRRFMACIKAEKGMEQHDYDAVLRACEAYRKADTTLTYHYAKALDAHHALGDSLFMIPVAGSTLTLTKESGVERYISRAKVKDKKHFSADYVLCGLLLDRDLDAFAQRLTKFYAINDSLPLYYKEALILYRHQRSTPAVVYTNDVMDSDYKGVHDMMHKCKTEAERKFMLERNYPTSYWRYYYVKL